MEVTVLNPIQLNLLQMFRYTHDEKRLEEMRDVLLAHIRSKVDNEMEKVWKEKNMNSQTIENLKTAHFRTPYNPQ